jgi:hypothetical protein
MLPERAGIQRILAAAGVPLFSDVEEMAECAAILSRCPAQKKTAVASPPPSAPPALKGRR